jgi:hypothetical protein
MVTPQGWALFHACSHGPLKPRGCLGAALWKNGHRCQIARRYSRRHGVEINCGRQQQCKGRKAKHDRDIVTSDFNLVRCAISIAVSMRSAAILRRAKIHSDSTGECDFVHIGKLKLARCNIQNLGRQSFNFATAL